MSVEEVLVYTRLAADKAGATKMDRPEDVEPSPHTGKLYVALTNNTQRGTAGKAGPDEANPRTQNRDGHVIELTERGNRADALEFAWNILLVAGDPAKSASTYFSGFPRERVSPISCPDNLAFDSEGNLWISTDGAPGTIGYNDGLFKVGLTGRDRGNVQQFLAVPQDAETCGPVIHDRERMVYVSVQHPGEDGSFEQPRSYFPDYVVRTRQGEGEWSLPRPSVAQVFAVGRGGEPEFPGAISDRPGQGRNQHKRRKNGECGPRYRGYRGKASPETKRAAKAAARSY
jgi:secreted PhoX family phosphatase